MLYQDSLQPANRIRGYGPGYFLVNENRYASSLVVTPISEVAAWEPRRPEDLDAGSFAMIADLELDLVIIGTGRAVVFPPPEVLAPLHRRGLGVEIMSTDAACRTYNIVAGEGRRVAALLLAIEA